MTSAIALSATTALVDLMNLVLWRPLPGGPSVVRVYTQSPQPFIGEFGYLPAEDFEDYRREASSFARWAGARSEGAVLEGPDAPPRALETRFVSEGFFEVLGLIPARGSLQLSGDETRGAILSYRLWQELFPEGGRAAIGSELRISGQRLPVLGVTPSSFHGIVAGDEIELWLPMTLGEQLVPSWNDTPLRQTVDTLARLADGVTREQAREELQILAADLDIHRPLPNLERKMSVRPGRLTHPLDQRNFRPIFRTLGIAVGLLFFLACANVVSLLLARTVERQRETALRSALGGSRLHLVRRLLLESSLLAGGSALLGFVGALLARRLLSLFDLGLFVKEMRFDHRVLLAGLAATALTSLLFGLLPVVVAGRRDLVAPLREGVQGYSRRSVSAFKALSTLQVALATVLLFAALGLAANLEQLREAPLGFDDRNLVRAFVDLRQWGLDRQQSTNLMRQIAEEIEALPDVASATRSSFIPPVFLDIETRFTLPSSADPEAIQTSRFNFVDGRYFPTLGLDVLAGRTFDQREREGAGTVVVNSELATQLWPDTAPSFAGALGRTVRVDRASQAERGPLFTVVGVVESLRQHDLRSKGEAVLYFSIDQRLRQLASVTARTTSDPEDFKTTFREALARVAPGAEKARIDTSEERRWEALVVERLQSQSAIILALAGLLLSATGIFGTMSLLVTARRRELAVRKALGASEPGALRWILGRCAVIVCAGLALAAPCSFAVARLLEAWLPEVPPPSASAFVAAAIALLVLSAVAALVPSLNGARVAAASALRSD
ncbi:MAG: ABC transporter permease [Acidobacteriota bacterium]